MIELRRFDSETGKIDILRYWQNSGNLMIKCHYSVRHWYCSQVERSYLTWSRTLIGSCCKMLTPDWSRPSAWGVTQCLWYCYQFILRRDNIGDLFRMFQTSRKLSDSVSNLRECLLLILLIIETFRCLHQQDNESFFFLLKMLKMSGGGPSFAGVSISALSAGGAPLPDPVIFCRYKYKFRVEIIVKICTFEFLLFTFLTTKGSMMLRKYIVKV